MSSTKVTPRQAEAIAAFYQRHLLPLAKMGAASVDISPRGPDGRRTTYVTRAVTRMSAEDFELRLGDERQIAETLRSRWQGTPLESLPAPLLRLAKEFEHAEQSAEISAFVYEMF